jgi:hypothetical protein
MRRMAVLVSETRDLAELTAIIPRELGIDLARIIYGGVGFWEMSGD